ncbi:hypothetical protein JCM19039_4231 [Geomicrobium sp. JCM 19039]|nr:hypothetical protein JCM19039_4231 [Geomicrobium sp. JCM 19039]
MGKRLLSLRRNTKKKKGNINPLLQCFRQENYEQGNQYDRGTFYLEKLKDELLEMNLGAVML